jgi:hypothetical protein
MHRSGSIYLATGYEDIGDSRGGSVHPRTLLAGDIMLESGPAKSDGGSMYLSAGDSVAFKETDGGKLRDGMLKVFDGGDISLIGGTGAKGGSGGNVHILGGTTNTRFSNYPRHQADVDLLKEEINLEFAGGASNEIPFRIK